MRYVDTKHQKKILAYTLLELLLVILIIAVLSVLGIAYYQQQTLSSKIDKTSLQMQQILQAASAYYVDNNCWPNSSQNNNCAQCNANAPNFVSYLPAGISTNPFGSGSANQYTYQPEPQLCRKFQVLSGALPMNVGNRVTASLPNAGSSSNNQIMAEIATPSAQPAQQPDIIIQHIDLSDIFPTSNPNPWQGSFSFNCPPGWQAHGIVTLSNMTALDWEANKSLCIMAGYWYGPGSNPIYNLSIAQDSGQNPIQPINCTGQNPATCTYDVTFETRGKKQKAFCPWDIITTGQIQLTEIGYCSSPQLSEQQQPTRVTPLPTTY